MVSGEIPRILRTLTRASPILLLGVEAPAVTPNWNGPSGSQSDSTSSRASAANAFLVPNRAGFDVDAAGVLHVKGDRVLSAQVR